MTLDDKVKKLRELLNQYPEMETPDDFDRELEKRRQIFKEISEEVDHLGYDMEKTWANNAWEKVKRKKMVVHPDEVLKGKKEWVKET